MVLLVLTSHSACVPPPEQVPTASKQTVQRALKRYPGRWLLIDESRDSLIVMNHDLESVVFSNIAFGTAGVGIKRRQGDGVTPQGEFKISDVRPSSKFLHFVELDYPTPAYAHRGLAEGVIPLSDFHEIIRAHRQGKRPPQYSPLGGLIGIHGLGKGDPWVHVHINWTAGCIALDNDQIERLVKSLRSGMRVVIRR